VWPAVYCHGRGTVAGMLGIAVRCVRGAWEIILILVRLGWIFIFFMTAQLSHAT